MDRFKSLMHRYLEGTLSKEETLEFLELVAEGDYSDQISDEVREKIAEEGVLPREKESFTNAYDKIRSVLNFTTEDDPVPYDASSETETKIVPLRRSRFWYARAAAIIVIAMASALLILSRGTKWFDPFATQQPEVRLSRYQGKQIVDLPDGSKIVLNANSELNFNRAAFGKTAREVNLVGEATFDVTHDASKPFLVRTGKVTTKVLGTEFNINAYPEQENITVTVLRGLVEVGDEQRVYGQIRPNEQIAVDVRSNQFIQLKTKAEEAVQWKRNFLILDDVDLEQAAEIIGKKFSVKITLENPELKECRIKVRFLNDESLDKILSVISRVTEVTYTIGEGGKVLLKGKGCR